MFNYFKKCIHNCVINIIVKDYLSDGKIRSLLRSLENAQSQYDEYHYRK